MNRRPPPLTSTYHEPVAFQYPVQKYSGTANLFSIAHFSRDESWLCSFSYFPATPASAVPATEFADTIEINPARLIGHLKRLVLAIVVAAGSYAALAFLVAAKGLIRSGDPRDPDFAEYFLIGSLASVLLPLSALWFELVSLHFQ